MTNPQQNALAAALEELCLSVECAAGVDEGASHDVASSEIMSAMGSAVAVSYDKARQALASNNPAAVEGQGEKARDAVIAAIVLWFESTTGFQRYDHDEKATVSACYGGNWISLRADRLADHLLAALAPAPGQWQPIETAPKDGGYILLTNSEERSTQIGFWNGSSWDDGDFYDSMGDFTHWMPLPIAPNADREGV